MKYFLKIITIIIIINNHVYTGLFSDKSQVQKSGDVITCFFCTVKNKNSQAARLIVGTPSPFAVLFSSKSLVCVYVFCLLHNFYHVISVSQEEVSLIASNVQICDFYK